MYLVRNKVVASEESAPLLFGSISEEARFKLEANEPRG